MDCYAEDVEFTSVNYVKKKISQFQICKHVPFVFYN
jgi:hypothetical protein